MSRKIRWSTTFLLASFPFLFVGTALNYELGLGLWADALFLVILSIGCKFYEAYQEEKERKTYDE